MMWSTSGMELPLTKWTVLPQTRAIEGCRWMRGWLKASSPKYAFAAWPMTMAWTGVSAVWTRSTAMSAADTDAPTTTTRWRSQL